MQREHRPELGGARLASWLLPWGLVAAVVVSAAGLTVARGVDVAAAQRAVAQPTGEGDELGELLYGRDCVGCHGPEGEGSPRGVPIDDAGEATTHYALVTGRMPIRDPDEVPQRGPSRYDDDEIEALVAHVAGFGDGPELPDVDWRAGDVPNGGELYRLHCAACHSSTAIGGALAYDRFAPSLMPSEPSVIAAAVVAGPGAMPAFAPQGFTDEELGDIIAYIQEVQDPVDRGGWPIFRAGRADEALLTWVIGVPVVLLTLSWIARRAR